jgi:hypothetical protein
MGMAMTIRATRELTTSFIVWNGHYEIILLGWAQGPACPRADIPTPCCKGAQCPL